MSFPSALLSFNRAERRGIIVLAFIMLAMIVVNELTVANTMFSNSPEQDDLQEAALFMDLLDSSERRDYEKLKFKKKQYTASQNDYPGFSKNKRRYYNKVKEDKTEPKYFAFNPNYTTQQEWMTMGFSEKQSAAIVKYINKAGPFKKPEDLLKLFPVDSSKYYQMEPYVDYSLIPENSGPPAYDSVLNITLNTSDPATWEKLPGLNRKIAYKITNYGEKLGGYHSLQQLKEVYGVRPGQIDSISDYIEIGSIELRKIALNECKAFDLKKHPYCNDWNVANAIVNHRDRYGKFRRIEDILKIQGITKEWFDKMKPYLSLNTQE